ncbi:MAG: hypothetical protein RIN55_03370 [Tissierellaceae bacterium]|nr:hypothetical protein [Tissierellaceae bacterium]
MFTFIFRFAITLFVLSIAGYILVVLKEKFFLKNNIIIIDNKHLTQDDLSETDINEFIFKGQRLKSGDEIQVITKEKEKVNGIIIGAKKAEDTIHIITYDNDVIKCRLDNILKFRVVSKYGRFFNN